jgi:hypothetical protein
MKIKLLVAAAATVVASSAMAQSAFQGFYGQIGTGYESNSLGSGSGNLSYTSVGVSFGGLNTSSQQFGNTPLIFGLGYNFSITPKWLLGIGADYSALSSQNSSLSSSIVIEGNQASLGGASMQLSNRYNIFITSGYILDKDKLVYLKAGYSAVGAKLNGPSSATVISNTTASATIPISFGSSTSTMSGYIVGLGYKQMITKGFYGFAEANYMSYGRASFSVMGSFQGQAVAISSNPSLSTYQALVGVGYKF